MSLHNSPQEETSLYISYRPESTQISEVVGMAICMLMDSARCQKVATQINLTVSCQTSVDGIKVEWPNNQDRELD
jgi:hypothetical protein